MLHKAGYMDVRHSGKVVSSSAINRAQGMISDVTAKQRQRSRFDRVKHDI